ncbi:hypothetical protein Salat_1875800 [Sesamum alatum]|uniref:CCHC-type domain-containing protein n=1 Tax=Sesamum alatum TaxID=300844 RepID=A0AAE1Y3P1_9LAMI|nr:hypothetical protein Salat_1875800 [Sesamum alatum]
MDDTGCAWETTLRLRMAINVTRPLSRAIPICSALGDERLVDLTYERLPNFCYLCEKLGHIAKYCELQFEDGFVDPGLESPYGPWLQAPLPTRGRKFSQPWESIGVPKSTSVSGSGSQRGRAVFSIFSGLGPGASADHGDRTTPRAGGIPTSAASFSPERMFRQVRQGVSEGYVQGTSMDSGSGSDDSMTAPAGLGPRAPLNLGTVHGQSDMGDPGIEDSVECVPLTLPVHHPVGASSSQCNATGNVEDELVAMSLRFTA